MKFTLFLFLLVGCLSTSYSQQEVSSPDGQIVVTVQAEKDLVLSISFANERIIDSVRPKMILGKGRVFGEKDRLVRSNIRLVDTSIKAVIPVKSAVVADHFQELSLSFQEYEFEIRVYNNGVAYRFISKMEQPEIEVLEEEMGIVFPEDFQCYFPEEQQLISHFENYYEKMPISEIPQHALGNLPILFTDEKGRSVSITESDVYDYPNLFLQKKAGKAFGSKIPKVVLETKELSAGQDRLEAVELEAPYLAKTAGQRSFPWRIFMISGTDKEIIENNLVYQLARPLQLKDVSWIKPGKVAWDWWNANNVYGVDFKSGINTRTYKYYIDFAADFGLEYIILDEGWSKSTLNVMEPNEKIDIEELTRYAEEKGVGIILWSLWRPLDKNMEELLAQYSEWGIKGVKVDFIQRADQYVVNFYERLARKAAEHEMIVNFHGSFKPSGMRRAYPNIVNYEGVKGLENNKWEDKISPEHNLVLPFTRMTAGVMDYTPGGMNNAHMENFMVRFERPMTLGTRAHQLAMYVVYEAPLQMLSDSPSNYYHNKESTDFISRIPTTWDETIVLNAKIADYLVLARRKGDSWYIGGMTDKQGRVIEIDFSFLDTGKEYTMEWIGDGENSDRNARDYSKGRAEVKAGQSFQIDMHSGGGWIAIISEKP